METGYINNEEGHQRKCQKGRIVPPKTAHQRGIYGQKMAKNGKNNLAGTIKGGNGDAKEEGQLRRRAHLPYGYRLGTFLAAEDGGGSGFVRGSKEEGLL